MFADRARYPHPHQLISPGHSPDSLLAQYDDRQQSFQYRAKESQFQPNLHPQKLPQKWPHYVLPLQHAESRGGQQTPKAVSQPHPVDASEHMLRRKTPNGTLSAGYDGTPVDWASRPHASKQFLVHGGECVADHTSTNSSGFPDIASTFSGQPYPMSMENLRQDTWTAHSPSFKQRVDSAVMTDESLTKMQWLQHDLRPPSIDSVLHQVPMTPQHVMNPNGYQQIPTVLQPLWPLANGPTASNAQFSYGPYWPDGSFEPYRPSAFRDGQFNAQFANINLNGLSDFQVSRDRQQWSRRSAPVARAGDLQSGIPGPPDQSQVDAARSDSDSFHARRSRSYNQPVKQTHASDPAASIVFYGNFTSNSTSAYRNDGMRTAPCLNTAQIPMSPLLENQTSLSSQHFKPKILAWAHRAYVSLVYQSKKNALKQPAEKGHTRASIFPKPPTSLSQGPETRDASHRPLFSGAEAGINVHQSSLDYNRNFLDNGISPKAHSQWPPPRSRSMFHERHDRGLRLSDPPSNYINSKVVGMHQSPGFAMHPSPYTATLPMHYHFQSPAAEAQNALDVLDRMCQESGWQWTDGILLGGCLAYGLEQFELALRWYSRVLTCDANNVEAISNMAATLLALKQRKDAERHWFRAVWLRPCYFEAVEHLVGLLCSDSRGREAIKVIEHVEETLRISNEHASIQAQKPTGTDTRQGKIDGDSPNDTDRQMMGLSISSNGFGSSGYRIPSSDNGRLLALIHAKGNLLYAVGDNFGAAKAFEVAVMIVAGRRLGGISGLIKHILDVFATQLRRARADPTAPLVPCETILLHPQAALKTAEYVFPVDGQLPGLRDVLDGPPRKAAISVASNSLLSLAKIYQDGMSSNGASPQGARSSPGVQDILALYYLSLSLQPSPSTANNVGILLASVQHSIPQEQLAGIDKPDQTSIPGVRPGSGIALALSYYNYGLNLDNRHAHLYTNLGSLLKDIGQLNAAIKMYEHAVACDGNFDIALANLANAVKDQGRISDAIGFYKRAVNSNPEFAEAVCGLANALNSVCCWKGRGGIVFADHKNDRWHVDEQGMLQDGREYGRTTSGWTGRVVSIVGKQLKDGQSWGKGITRSAEAEQLFSQREILEAIGRDQATQNTLIKSFSSWAGQEWEGAKLLRFLERATKRLGWRMYHDKYVLKSRRPVTYSRPRLPASLPIPSAPTVLPFHTFTCPLTASQVRKISQRNGLRISCSTLKAPWLPSTVFEPPAPPQPHLNVGYVSSDFNNHPLAHLMQSVFGFHNQKRVKAFCYATTASDGSPHREQIQREAPVFRDASLWPTDKLVKRIVDDGVHILVNLNGYTRGARNEVFAARPAPVQMSFMGFAGTLGAEWCDYLLADSIAVPPSMLRPYRNNVSLLDQTVDQNFGDDKSGTDWVYGENIIFARDTFFCCDHRQSAPDSQEVQLSWPEEQERRKKMRKELFPDLPDDVVIMGNFNQLYKVFHHVFARAVAFLIPS